MLSIDIKATIGTLSMAFTLRAEPGVTVIIGPNGAGKSTLLRCLLGAIEPDSGAVELGEHTLFRRGLEPAIGALIDAPIDVPIDVPMEERRLGYLPQKYALFPHMTVSANVGFGVADKTTRAKRVSNLLDDLGIAHLAKRKAAGLSGGEAQRVALGRALAIGPRALLLDEPMAALDATTRTAVRAFLRERLAALEIPTLIVSHDVADARALADRVAVLEAGSITQVGTLEELRAEPASEFVAEFTRES